MEQITEGHPARRIPGGKVYTLKPYILVLECDCGERMLYADAACFRCRCGTDHEESVRKLMHLEPESWYEDHAAWLDGDATLYPDAKSGWSRPL